MDYPLENLSPEAFQRVCGALLLREFPSVRFLPLGQQDGGRDGFVLARSERAARQPHVVFQVKFARDLRAFSGAKAARIWVLKNLQKELPNAEKLAAQGFKHYRLITNVRGSGTRHSGSVDKLDQLFADFPIPAEGWWRDDLLPRLDTSWDLKWRYPELMTGPDLLRALVEGGLTEHASRRAAAIRTYVEDAGHQDALVKFKQVGLENDLLDLFVDLPLEATRRKEQLSRRAAWSLATLQHDQGSDEFAEPVVYEDENGTRIYGRSESRAPAAGFLLSPNAENIPALVIEGAPGQGKSTVTQYVCQVHRCRLLGRQSDLARIPERLLAGGLRLPFRVDLRDLAAWVHGRDPFGGELTTQPARRSLESFLAAMVEYGSGGSAFSLADLHAVCRTSSFLLALDGLDEVADIAERNRVVTEVSDGVRRLRSLNSDLQVVITSRPAAFENSPGFAADRFAYLELAALTEAAVKSYTDKWITARSLDRQSARDVRRVVRDKLQAPHMRDLARNPMQLAILLTLVHQRGPSLPDKRTALYDNYVSIFFDREAEKTESVARNRDLLQEIHQFLAWKLQTETELGHSEGSITDAKLHELLRDYLSHEEKDPALVQTLFTSLVERVVAIVSRVQGTYEFEVQPLREYFAARFLYDTAHHSSPGNEPGGDKSDRFDALSRNFYWLNVTRFFAGCFSRGELLSLVDRLRELADEEGVRDTNHPQVLAAMLLSDWVFAHQPRSMKAVVNILLEDVARSGDPDDFQPAIALPEGSGRAEVAQRCWEMWEREDLPSDRSEMVARTLGTNSDVSNLDSAWHEQTTSTGNELRNTWLTRGLWLGSVSRQSSEQFERLLCDDDFGYARPERLRLALQAGHAGVYESDKDRASYALQTILDCQVSRPAPSGRAQNHPLDALSTLRFAVPRYRYRRYRAVSDGEDGAQIAIPEYLKEVDVFTEAALQTLRDYRRKIETSLDPWNEVVERLRQAWGESRLAVDLALQAAGIRSSTSRGELGDGLGDRGVPLCERARAARFRAGNVSWWTAQISEQRTPLDQYFVYSLCAAWASDATLSAHAEQLDAWICDQSPMIRSAFARTVSSAGVLMGGAGPRKDVDLLGRLPSKLNPVTAIILDRRHGAGDGPMTVSQKTFERYLSGSDLQDAFSRTIAVTTAVNLAMTRRLDWKPVLKLASAVYEHGAAPSRGIFYESDSTGAMPVTLAREVAQAWDKYPVVLVNLARQVCRVEVGREAIPLARIAEEQDWSWR